MQIYTLNNGGIIDALSDLKYFRPSIVMSLEPDDDDEGQSYSPAVLQLTIPPGVVADSLALLESGSLYQGKSERKDWLSPLLVRKSLQNGNNLQMWIDRLDPKQASKLLVSYQAQLHISWSIDYLAQIVESSFIHIRAIVKLLNQSNMDVGPATWRLATRKIAHEEIFEHELQPRVITQGARLASASQKSNLEVSDVSQSTASEGFTIELPEKLKLDAQSKTSITILSRRVAFEHVYHFKMSQGNHLFPSSANIDYKFNMNIEKPLPGGTIKLFSPIHRLLGGFEVPSMAGEITLRGQTEESIQVTGILQKAWRKHKTSSIHKEEEEEEEEKTFSIETWTGWFKISSAPKFAGSTLELWDTLPSTKTTKPSIKSNFDISFTTKGTKFILYIPLGEHVQVSFTLDSPQQ